MMLNKIKKNKSDQTNLVQLWEMILYPVVCRTIHDMCNVRVVGIKSRWQALPLVELLQICANRRVQDSGSFWSLPWSWHGNDTREVVDYTVSKIDEMIIEFSGKIVELTAKLEAMKHKYNQNIELRESSFMEKRLEKLPRRSGRL